MTLLLWAARLGGFLFTATPSERIAHAKGRNRTAEAVDRDRIAYAKGRNRTAIA